ncbi:ABC transporter substrate-binding protein [bacterium]|nr:ABC transporter substrate-binding protein [bacterium]MCB2179326.1 ABC transporter substrate-binding protein [bacterium]
MTRKLLFVLTFLFIFALAACGGQSDVAENNAGSTEDTGTLDQTVNCTDLPAGDVADLGGQEIVMAVENAYPPFNILDDNGEGIGWDYDMGRALCDILNCTPVFQEAAWDGIFPAMAAGEYDVLFDGVTYLTERDKSVDFSCAYVVIGQVLLTRSDEDRFSTAEEFAANPDWVVATQITTTNEIVAHDLVGVDRTNSFEDFGLAVQALISGDVDAVVIDTVTALGFIDEHPGDISIKAPITSDEQLALVFPPGSELTAAFDSALAQMAADGSLTALNDKWFNP